MSTHKYQQMRVLDYALRNKFSKGVLKETSQECEFFYYTYYYCTYYCKYYYKYYYNNNYYNNSIIIIVIVNLGKDT